MNDEVYYNFDSLNNLSFDYMMGGCSYESVISSLSLKYCMCDITDGYADYSLLYSNLLDISSYIPEPTHNKIKLLKQNLMLLINLTKLKTKVIFLKNEEN